MDFTWSIEYLDPESINGLNLYCYCNNDLIDFIYSSFGVNYHVRGSKVRTYGLVAYDTYIDVMGYINNGDSWQKITASGIVTAGLCI